MFEITPASGDSPSLHASVMPSRDVMLSKDELRALIDLAKERNAIIELHPLGFLNLALSGDRLSSGLYLHVWPDEPLPRLEAKCPIHSHTFDLRSRVLAGALENNTFTITPAEHGSHNLYAITFLEKESVRSFVRKVNVSRESSVEIQAGQVYDIPIGHFHTTGEPTRFTATLMLKYNVQPREPAFVLSEGAIAARDVRFSHEHFGAQRSWQIVRRVLDEMREVPL